MGELKSIRLGGCAWRRQEAAARKISSDALGRRVDQGRYTIPETSAQGKALRIDEDLGPYQPHN
ncbi:MAG TPA: hypothetical protein VLX12_07330 [Syntrophorhabdales bacterium]|nr:hypothetical protein [Syntrophorhabdales bacterium]